MTKSFELVRDAITQNGDALFHFYTKLDRHISKKNSRPILRNRRTWKPFLGKSGELISAEHRLIESFRTKVMREASFQTINQPMWCIFWFFFPADEFVVKRGERKGQLSGRVPDLSNLYEFPQDCMQKAGVISNDNLICSHDLSRRLPGDECALEIFIFRYQLDSVRLKVVP